MIGRRPGPSIGKHCYGIHLSMQNLSHLQGELTICSQAAELAAESMQANDRANSGLICGLVLQSRGLGLVWMQQAKQGLSQTWAEGAEGACEASAQQLLCRS